MLQLDRLFANPGSRGAEIAEIAIADHLHRPAAVSLRRSGAGVRWPLYWKLIYGSLTEKFMAEIRLFDTSQSSEK